MRRAWHSQFLGSTKGVPSSLLILSIVGSGESLRRESSRKRAAGQTELGVVRPKTANAIGPLPIKESPLDFAEDLNDKKEVVE